MPTPSFSSFPLSFNSFPDIEGEYGSSSGAVKDLERSESGHGDSRRKKDKDKGYRHERTKERNEKTWHKKELRSRSKERVDIRSDDKDEHLRSSSRLFYQDHKGDSLNVTYGGLHTGDVPRYRLVSRGRKVLGLEGDWSVMHRGGKGIVISNDRFNPRGLELSDKKALRHLTSIRPRKLVASAKTDLMYEEVDGFIRLKSHKGKGKDQEYRAISLEEVGNSESESEPSDDTQSDKSEDSDTLPTLTAREESIKAIEQRLQANPEAISDWMLLLEHSLCDMPRSNKSGRLARSEITVSVLSRALDAHPTNVRSTLLRLMYLHAGGEIWDEKILASEWESALRTCGTTDLWVEWLNYQLGTTVATFESGLQSAIRTLESIPVGLSGQDSDIASLRIFWRIAVFMKQAGFIERGMAMFQAQAELLFHIPEELRDQPRQVQLDALEEFWEAEIPRVGDRNAKGWRASKAALAMPSQSDKMETTTNLVEHRNVTNLFSKWCYHEAESDKTCILPRKTADMDHEDPYTIVLFADIRPFMISLRTKQGRALFRLIWLSFLGVHIPGLTSALSAIGLDDKWANLTFIRPYVMQQLFPSIGARRLLKANSVNGTIIGSEKSHKSSFGVIKEWSLDLFEPLEGWSVDCRGRIWEHQDSFECNYNVICDLFKLLREEEDLHWDALSIAFDASGSRLQSALKRSQNLLSKDSSSPELLVMQARLERIGHRYEKARKVYRIGISALSGSVNAHIVDLWWDSAELEWLLSQNDAALDVILAAAGQAGGRIGVAFLRAKRRLEDSFQQLQIPWKYRLKWLKLRILLELLTGSIESAIETARTFQAAEIEGDHQHESLVVTILSLIYNHIVILRNHARPGLLRDLVHSALESYPNNTFILGMFLESEKSEGMWGRVRALLGERRVAQAKEKPLSRRVMEIWFCNWEDGRWFGEIERIRSCLEAATASYRTSGSFMLWKIFVKFEIAAGDLKRAKSVLYRALGECPLAKELYLMAFEDDLRTAFAMHELLSLADTMAEKGIRLRRSLNDMSEAHGELNEERNSNVSDGSGEEDEVEYNSRELRRLRPY